MEERKAQKCVGTSDNVSNDELLKNLEAESDVIIRKILQLPPASVKYKYNYIILLKYFNSVDFSIFCYLSIS